MEAEFPTFTQSLLQMVYPHYLAPTPSMAVVQFNPEQTLRAMAQGAVLPAGTELRSLLGTEDQTNCEFRTGHEVQLLPIEIADAEYIASPGAVAALGLPEQRGVRAAIRIRLRTTGEASFSKLALDRLVVFLSGPEGARVRLYEQLLANLAAVYVRPTERPLPWQERLPDGSVRALGFDQDEALLPRVSRSFDGYRLLQEYYAMPERFLFVEFGGLDRPAGRCAGKELEMLLLLTRSEPTLATGFGPEQLALFCTPAVNLFAKRSDRINLSGRESELHIVPDRMRPLDYEVFSVSSVEGFAADGSAPQPFLPFYATNDLSRMAEHKAYYALSRVPRQLSSRARVRGPRSTYLGHEVFISLVDGEHAPYPSGLRQLGLELMCTNRDLPLSMPVGKQHTDFTIAVSAPVASIRCLVGPVAPKPCRSDGEYAWRFISHLGLNYLGVGAAARGAVLGFLPSDRAAHPRQRTDGGGAGAAIDADDRRDAVRRGRRHSAGGGAGSVFREICFGQRVHRDGADEP
jgi:type VI secretion system protein ImpG